MARGRKKGTTLGERVRALRLARSMTLSDLSKASGISVATLSKLENGLTGLTLDNTILLSAAFPIPVSALLGETEGPTGACSVARAREAYSHSVEYLDFKVLHDDLPAQRNLFWEVCVRAHSLEEFGPLHAHPGEEFFRVLRGRVQFHLEDREPVILKAGDSAQFDSAIGHAYIAVGKKDAVILMANTVVPATQTKPSLRRKKP